MDHRRATTLDYLIRTYFRIFKIKEGPLFEKYYRRFNNIIFNNFDAIADTLTLTVFTRQVHFTMQEHLSQVQYLSYVYKPDSENERHPLVVQYFDKYIGIQHRLLGFTLESELMSTISAFNLVEKSVGFCGDFGFRECPNSDKPGYIRSLKILSANKFYHVPYCDGVLHGLFDVILSYLPGNIAAALLELGTFLVQRKSQINLLKECAASYQKWLKSGCYLLESDYVEFIITNYDSLNSLLLNTLCVPKNMGLFFCRLHLKFFLSFIKELYDSVKKIQFNSDTAVGYYVYLNALIGTFKTFEDVQYLPIKAWKLLQDLEEVKGVNLEPSTLKDIHTVINCTNSRAIKYLEFLPPHFEGFQSYTWLLDSPLDYDKVHHSFHVIYKTSCQQCLTLRLELTEVNNFLLMGMISEDMVTKWMTILQQCQVPIIEKMVQFLFSLPASHKVVHGMKFETDVEKAEEIIRMNLGEFNVEETQELEEATDLVRMMQISALVD